MEKWKSTELVGGWPTLLKNMKVSWDDYSEYMEKQTNVPNHQPDIVVPPISIQFTKTSAANRLLSLARGWEQRNTPIQCRSRHKLGPLPPCCLSSLKSAAGMWQGPTWSLNVLYVHVCMYIYMYKIHIYIYVCMYMYIYICVCMYVCMYVCIYIYVCEYIEMYVRVREPMTHIYI